MKKLIFILFISMANLLAMADNNVTVSYNGTSATVTVDDNIAQYVTVAQSGAHVSITQSADVNDLVGEITYTLTGSSNDGEFYMSGSYKATVELNGLTLTNTTPVYSGAAVHIQNGKRVNVKVVTGTTNTLADAASGSQKGCLYVKGHAEFKQKGTLNVIGNCKHGIKAGEYISIKNANINITSAVGDGISCNEYFLMESGTVTINGTEDDGLQCDLDGETSTGMTTDHEEEDSGNVYVSGGTITITCDAIAAKGIKCAGDAYISDNAIIDITTTGKGEWDETDLETNSACGLSADGDINISGGTISLTATGSGGKGMKCDNVLNISGGNITISTTGGLYYNNGTTENTNYTGNTDNISNNYYSSAKGIKVGYKDESGSTTICYGGVNISGGTIYVSTKGRNAEGIESKNYLNITGGETTIDAYDDGINAAQDLTVTDGYLYAHSSNNDGIDANGNVVIEGGLIYAIGGQTPEVAIDANSEENKKFYFNGGVLITIGGLESGSNLSQTCYQASSCSSNTWYSLTYDGNVIAFLTPTISSSGGGWNPGGGPGGSSSTKLVVSAPSTPTLKSGVTVGSGTPIFYGPRCYVDATVTGGSSVSLSQYSSGGGGWNPGGGSSSYNVTASANPSAGGSVTGGGNYTAYTLCTLTATANPGYTFSNWTRNGSVASTNTTYSFYVSEAATCVANFTLNTFNVAAKATPEEGGTVTGAGTYGYGSTCTLTATPNAGYQFVNWTVNGEEVSADLEYSFTVTESVAVEANFSVDAEYQEFSLTPGWNWWSTYIEMNGVNGLALLEDALGTSGIQIKSQSSFVTYDEGWFGTLNGIVNEQSYRINMGEGGNYSLAGTIADPTAHPIAIGSGWNWIGYVENVEMDLNTAMANLDKSGDDIVKSRDCFSTYYAGYGWWGTLESLQPGGGYMYKASASGTLVYPEASKVEAFIHSPEAATWWNPDGGSYADNMSVMAVVEVNGEEVRSEEVEIGAFSQGECRGAVRLLYVAPLDRYVAFLTVHGEDGDGLSFRLKNDEGVLFARDRAVFAKDAVLGSTAEPYVLRFGNTGVTDAAEPVVTAYPNPSTGVFQLEGEGMERVEVYTMLGELVRMEEVHADTHTLNLSGCAEGVYHLRVHTQNGLRHLSVVVAE